MTSYTCDCIGTQYKGSTCQTGIINLPSLPVLSVGQESDLLWISAKPDVNLTITFTYPDNALEITSAQVTLMKTNTNASFTIRPLQAGTIIMSYTLSGASAADYEDPRSITVLVLPSLPHSPIFRYFTTLGRSVGSLAPGCCDAGPSYQCPSSSSMVSFLSSCGWSDDQAGGVVFTQGAEISMPLSITGTELSLEPYVQNSLPSDSATCPNCGGDDSSCYHFDFTTGDIIDLLLSRALGNSYIERSSQLLPTWLGFNIGATFLTDGATFSHDHYRTILAEGDRVRTIEHCASLDVDSSGLYSLLLHHENIGMLVNSLPRNYVPSAGNAPICFAVDLCRGSSSPVYISIPAGSHDTLTSFTQLSQYINRGWQFTFTDAAVSRTGLSLPFSVPDSYWNGMTTVTPNIPNFDLRLNMTMNSMLTSNDLWLRFSFNGIMFHQANPLGPQVRSMLACSSLTDCEEYASM